MATNVKKSVFASKQERLIYVGPPYKGGKLLKYQVFIGGLPKHIDDVLKNARKLKTCLCRWRNW